jgi:hypothetical protein
MGAARDGGARKGLGGGGGAFSSVAEAGSTSTYSVGVRGTWFAGRGGARPSPPGFNRSVWMYPAGARRSAREGTGGGASSSSTSTSTSASSGSAVSGS